MDEFVYRKYWKEGVEHFISLYRKVGIKIRKSNPVKRRKFPLQASKPPSKCSPWRVLQLFQLPRHVKRARNGVGRGERKKTPWNFKWNS